MKEDPLLWFADPILRKNTENREIQPPADESARIDREIEKVIAEARFKSAVAVAKAELIDDLRRLLLEARRG